mmetsp:Transcript_36790/g.37446  ORF Transcript_36790/g.37446 Transcript_36790/m.37446 type:complete len:325 (+) Transcript_36790:254-1228(+)
MIILYLLLLFQSLILDYCSGSYYDILGVNRKSEFSEIKKAYKQQAMRWHPDKNPTNQEEAENRFKEVNEAYSTLSDPQKRKAYDLYGEDAIKQPHAYQEGPTAPGKAFGFEWSNRFDDTGSFSNNMNSEWFGTETGEGMSDRFNDFFGQFFPGFGSRPVKRKPYRKALRPTKVSLYCSLDELYTGCLKKMHIRDELLVEGEVIAFDKILTVEVLPGWKHGTPVTYPPSDEFPNKIILTIKETKHRYFTRKGSDLKWKCRLTRKQAENGVLIRVPRLDGEVLSFSTKGMTIRNGEKRRFTGLGMPIEGTNGEEKGDLVIKFQIIY